MTDAIDPAVDEKIAADVEAALAEERDRQAAHAIMAQELMSGFTTVYYVDSMVGSEDIDIVSHKTPAITDTIVVVNAMQVPRVSGRGTWFKSFNAAKFYALDQLSSALEDSMPVMDVPAVQARATHWKTNYRRLKKMTVMNCKQGSYHNAVAPNQPQERQKPTKKYAH